MSPHGIDVRSAEQRYADAVDFATRTEIMYNKRITIN